MDTTDFVVAGAVIIGLVNGFRLLEQPDKRGFYYFLGAVAMGVLFGAIGWFGLPSIEVGLTVALGSSGLYRVGQVVSGK